LLRRVEIHRGRFAAGLLVVILITIPILAQTRTGSAERLDPRIGPARPRLYRKIQDGRDWKNPKLHADPDGVRLFATGLPAEGVPVALAGVPHALVALDVKAWPYGRVVMISEGGPVNPDRLRAIRENFAALTPILKALDVLPDPWP